MTFQRMPAAMAVGAAALVSLFLAVFAWRHRAAPLGWAFAAMMAGETLWALGAALEPLVVELPFKRAMLDVRLLGTAVAILGLVAFVFRFVGLGGWLTPGRFGLIAAPAVPILLMAWLDPWWPLYWRRFENAWIWEAWIAVRTPGPGFWSFVAYGYALAALAAGLLTRAVFRLSGIHRAHAGVMLFGVLLPWSVDILDTLGVWTFTPVDLVSVSFAVTGLTFVPAVLRLRLLDLTPVAWAAVIRRMPEAVVVLDERGRMAALNPAAEKLLGRPAVELLGREAARAFEPWPLLAPLLGRLDQWTQETSLEVVHPGGPPVRHYEANLSRLRDPARPAGWVLVLRDITERWSAAEGRARMAAEQEARAEAEAASHAKDVFLAMLSHELRTPLTPVLATVSALLDDPSVPGPLVPTLKMIRRNIELEARLIDNLLDQTRIRQGMLSLRLEVVDAHELIDRAVEICGDDLFDAELTLVTQLHAEAHHVQGDATALQQVLWNLLKNAIKFSPPGKTIWVRSSNREDPEGKADRPWLVIEVVDQGIGIESELLPRVFDFFERGGSGRGRTYGGLGLGLAISRDFAERHGGRLSGFSSGPGRGSTFTLVLPAAPTPAPAPAPAAATPPALIPPGAAAIQPSRRLRLLLVEDNRDTLEALAEQLQKRGHEVQTARTLNAALTLLERAGLDLLISDIELPDGDGHELMSLLRARGPVPGIALSGFGTAEDVRRSLAAGFAEHLTKPVQFQVLDQCIQRVASRFAACARAVENGLAGGR